MDYLNKTNSSRSLFCMQWEISYQQPHYQDLLVDHPQRTFSQNMTHFYIRNCKNGLQRVSNGCEQCEQRFERVIITHPQYVINGSKTG